VFRAPRPPNWRRRCATVGWPHTHGFWVRLGVYRRRNSANLDSSLTSCDMLTHMLTQRQSGKRGFGVAKCALPGCEAVFERKKPWQAYHSIEHLREADRLAYLMGRAALGALQEWWSSGDPPDSAEGEPCAPEPNVKS
jgi:hypothetical protein